MVIGLAIGGATILIVGGWVIGTYNRFITGKQNIRTQLSNIKTEYQRRADLFYNLVQSVKSYAKFEKSALIEVIKARSGNFGDTKEKVLKTMHKLDGIFSKLMLLFEQYPKLRAVEQYNSLSEELKTTENRINVARTSYNDIVREYNILIKTFPTNLLGNVFRFTEEEFYINEKETEKAPKLDL